MSQQRFVGSEEQFLRRYEYDDAWVVAVDLGVGDDDVDVDIVGDTAIVVVDTGESVTESEFELPGTSATVETTNGVLTITIEK